MFGLLKDGLAEHQLHYKREPRYADFRTGDARHTQADISKAAGKLGFHPTEDIQQGLKIALPWYLKHFAAERSAGNG